MCGACGDTHAGSIAAAARGGGSLRQRTHTESGGKQPPCASHVFWQRLIFFFFAYFSPQAPSRTPSRERERERDLSLSLPHRVSRLPRLRFSEVPAPPPTLTTESPTTHNCPTPSRRPVRRAPPSRRSAVIHGNQFLERTHYLDAGALRCTGPISRHGKSRPPLGESRPHSLSSAAAGFRRHTFTAAPSESSK